MCLAALPSELLSQIVKIISRITPKDIESIGRTSRRLREIAAPYIKEHRALLKAYTKLSLNNTGAAKTLFEICKRPWVALYPQSLEVSADRNWTTLERPRNVRQRAVVEDVTMKRSMITDDELGFLVQGTELVPHQDMYEWIKAINRADEDYVFAILLACLPNLQRFIIRLDLNKMERMKQVLRSIQALWSQRQALPNLRTVHVLEKEGSSTCDLEMFPLFAAIPGVQKIHGSVTTLSFHSISSIVS